MANRRANRPSIVPWDRMRTVWRRSSRGSTTLQNYFDTFISQHKNYQFTVAQVYHGLYELGITCEQYDAVKIEIERKSGRVLPEINCTDILENGDVRKKSFRNNQEYQTYQVTFLEENNKRLVREKRQEVKEHFEKTEKYFKEANGKLILSFDVEVYEYDHNKMLELGYIVVRLGSEAPEITEKCHFIIEENAGYKNKDFVTDNRDGFRFGESETVLQKEAVMKFRRAVEGSAFVVAHSARSDESFLKRNGVDLAELKTEIVDTMLIQQHKEFEAVGVSGNRLYLRGLTKLLDNFGVCYQKADLHNAGCDAYYTMKVFLRQMGHSAAVVNSL